MKKNVKDVTKQFHAAMERAKVLKQSARFLLAVSGGPDSMALLHLMATEYPNEILGVAHVDHCLRPSSAEEAAMVEQTCRNYGIAFHFKRADVAAIAKERKIGLEEAGRHLRYEFFSVLGYDYVVTAHHKNDQAETVLGNIVRGCGYNGIKGMVLKDGPLLRPFLEISKDALVAYCRQHQIEFAWDHTNDELCCRRNVLRHRVLPELETMNPAVIDALCRLSHLAEDENQWMEQM
ncbi:MAG: tRNA lysidine(34) synthetase TilS, partial [Bacillota bacterium]|nr:tRNA lysidine(34) synthetase TilS [Bacillota bacterium]